MKVVHETIEVKGEAPRDVELQFTRHGPVLNDDGQGHAFAMRTVWNEPGASGYFGSLAHVARQDLGRLQGRPGRLGRAAAEPGLRRHRRRHRLVGRRACTPIRPNWDGLMPVPGDGRYEWAGLR